MEALLSPSSTEMPRKKSVRFSVPVQKATSSVSLNNMEHQKATQKQEEAEDGDVEDPHLAPTTSSASFTRKVGDDDEPSWSRVLLHYGDDLNFAHCSIRSCRPQWLQVVARREVFLLLYCLLGVTYGMSHTFTVSVISTIEKSFHLSSKQTGVILAGSWAVQAAVSTLLLLHGQSVHRGRWMVIGVVAGVASCLLAVVPQVVYGSGEVTREAFGEIERTETCFSEVTDENEESCKVFYEEFFVGPVIMLFISQFFIGIAISIFYSIGASYLDDINNHSPQYFGITLLLRVVGPVCGFLLGGSCVRVWISPSHDAPNLARNDPRWLGSWWIGFLFLGCCVLVLGGLLLLFLHNLTLKKGMVREGKRREASRSHWKVSNFNIFTTMRKEATLSIHDLPKTLKRLFTNKIWVGNLFSSVAFFLAFACYINFKSKYLEAEFRKSASEANFYTGLVTLVGSLLGIAVSTALVRWAPQGPRSLAACDTLLSALVFASFLGLMFIGCPRLQVVGPREKSAEGTCSAKCGCSDRFSPLCLVQNHTILFYSACYAGCLTVDDSTEPVVYRNCSCISHVTSSSTQPGLPDTDDLKNIVLNTTATSGYCPEPCENFAYYLVMQVLTNAVYTTGRLAVGIGHLRGVSERDKEVSLAILAVLVTVFGILPAPIIMGAAIDWSCSVWGTQCGGTGHCWLYDTHTLRLLVHLIPAVFTFISLIGDLVVFFCSHQLDDYDKRERRRRRVGEARVHVQGGRGVQV
ncbi:solute carrier organic anion transporter family member 74D [Procambarus clarkii]|uniref:solute carrier organic anion transporter family member 74D n=1 Tax=Procambarus clarkii TaxID=6728 RepID=UPI001E672DF2|nr:solute carrier organic anion transporter family member 74D-like [Procambarus clarkii]